MLRKVKTKLPHDCCGCLEEIQKNTIVWYEKFINNKGLHRANYYCNKCFNALNTEECSTYLKYEKNPIRGFIVKLNRLNTVKELNLSTYKGYILL